MNKQILTIFIILFISLPVKALVFDNSQITFNMYRDLKTSHNYGIKLGYEKNINEYLKFSHIINTYSYKYEDNLISTPIMSDYLTTITFEKRIDDNEVMQLYYQHQCFHPYYPLQTKFIYPDTDHIGIRFIKTIK